MQEAHLRWCTSRGLRQNTIDSKRSTLARFARAVEPSRPEEASAEQLALWWETINHCVPGTRACELSHVRQFFGWLCREGFRVDDPTRRLDAPRVPRRLPRPIGNEELALAIKRAREPIRSWMLFGCLAGLRCWEIGPLRRDELLTDRDPPLLYVADGKGGRDRLIPLHPVLCELELPDRGYLWPTLKGHISAQWVSTLINKHFRTVGVRATAHMLRHTFATRLYEASGCDLLVTQNCLGHENPGATAIYTAWSQDKAAMAVAGIAI